MKSIIVEGWTGYTISQSVLNMYQLASMARRSDIRLFHREAPGHFRPGTRLNSGLLLPEQEAAIASIPAPGADQRADALFRITHPYLATPSPHAARTWVWGASEMGCIEQHKIADKRPVRDALQTPGVSWITCSQWSARGMARSGADPDRIAVVLCGFDPAVFSPVSRDRRAELRRILGWEGHSVFLNVSTLTPYKGVHAMLAAFARVASRHPGALLVLKGSDTITPSQEFLRQALATLPDRVQQIIVPRLRYMGSALHASQIADMMRAADCYLSPYHGEGFNIPVLEAAACGLPSIVTGGGPTDEFTTPDFAIRTPSERIENNPAIERAHAPGAIALSPDLETLVEQACGLVSNDAQWSAMSAAGPAYVRDRYTWDHIADSLVRVLTADDPNATPEMKWNRDG